MALPAAAAEEPVVFGKWKFHDTVQLTDTFSCSVKFTDEQGINYYQISINKLNDYIKYRETETIDLVTAYDFSGSWTWREYRQTIDFGSEPQVVTVEFYDWLISNAVLLKCDGSDCPSTDLNKDNFCDDCGLEFLVLRDYGPYTVRKFMVDIGNILTSAASWVSDVGAAIISQPLLLAFTALPLCGLGIAVYRRLKGTA
jgi:hypothetical protein